MGKFVENVQSFIDDACDIVAQFSRDEFEFMVVDYMTDSDPIPQSPIEQILFTALCLVRKTYGVEKDFAEGISDPWWGEGAMAIEPQCSIGPYRADFLIRSVHLGEDYSFVVECDGHEFHDRSEKQRRYEKQRDRFFQKKGYKVFHFTGAEIVRNPYRVACEIMVEAQQLKSPNAVINSIIEYVPQKYKKELDDMMEDGSMDILLSGASDG